jgi:drug/metabolite transporter (DMT)-like permease
LCKQPFEDVIVNQGCFTIVLRQTTSEDSVIIIMITALGPVLVLVLRALKLEALTIAKVLGMAICFLGVTLLEAESGYSKHSPCSPVTSSRFRTSSASPSFPGCHRYRFDTLNARFSDDEP